MRLEQLVSLTLWQGSQAEEALWVSWCGIGKEDEGGEGGREKQGCRAELLSLLPETELCVPVPHVRHEVFIFFLSLFFWF